MAGPDPAIYVLSFSGHEDVDARHEAGHDETVDWAFVPSSIPGSLVALAPRNDEGN
jgi:hypothetical protein